MATGNPRNKVALKPGFSLVGWIRLTNSGEDLAKRKGAISPEELKKHDKIDDCWMAIRGKVYNVTRYMDYHPGGAEQLMRGAGKDATSLFDEYHAWVNIEQLLAKCYIGPLKNVVVLNLSDINEVVPKKAIASSLSPPTTKTSSLLSIQKTQVPAQITPRFDWIQKMSELTIYFYLKSFCNPGIIIEQICDKECKVTIFIGNNIIYTFKFSFNKALKWAPKIKVNQETGKIEITFEKDAAELWQNYGMHERISTDACSKFSEFIIVKREFINHDSYELILRPKNDKIMYFISLGHHVDLKANINGKDVMRSYTPVPQNYLSSDSGSELNFVIKKYDTGIMSKFLSEAKIGDEILVSQQLGSFELSQLNSHSNIAFLAAGSGITPFCGLLDHLLARNTNHVKSIALYNFNKTEGDIWFRKLFDEMSGKDKRLRVEYVLSEPDESWHGERGKVSDKILQELTKCDTSIVLICGPISFNSEALRILSSASPQIEAICFQG